jgi:surfeit locus 1 family protein
MRLTPAPDCDCPERGGAQCLREDRLLVVEADFETLTGERSGPPTAVEIERPEQPGAFTPQNDAVRGDYYRFDQAGLAAAFGVDPEQIDTQWWLAAVGPGLPPGLAAIPPARHIGYALTWFGLAATLIGVYFAYHHRQGRFGFRTAL